MTTPADRDAEHRRLAALIAADEFVFLRERVGASLPEVRRVVSTTSDGAAVSGLAWGGRPRRLLYLHGRALHARSWDATILAHGGAALALDLPGHGESSWWDAAHYTPARIAEAVRTAAPHLDGPVTVVGQSLGGLVGIALTEQDPSWIDRLVLVDISPTRAASPTPGGRSRSGVAEFIGGPASYATHAEIVDRAMTFGIGRSPESLLRGVLQNTRIRDDGRIVFKHHLGNGGLPGAQTFDSAELWTVLERVEVPVMLVHGSRGILDEAQLDEFRQRVPHARIERLDAGHNVQRDAPAELAALITDATGR